MSIATNTTVPLFNRINELLSNSNAKNLIQTSPKTITTFKINTSSTSPSISPSTSSSSASPQSSLSQQQQQQPKSVSCSFVKTNTNIYYNVKIDNCASKAIHYCLNCTNYNCKAIHKSVCKSFDTQQQQQTRISLNNNNTKQLSSSNGPNINFIFERRYPTHQHNNANLHTILPATFPNGSTQQPPIQQRLNNFPLPLSPITSTSSLSINFNRDNETADLVNLLNLSRSFRNTFVLDQVRSHVKCLNSPPLS
jgi:hypothetical protein